MNLQNLQTVLEETFGGNFISYYRTHVAHVNIQGRSFYQDHKLLQKIYEYFQDNIDTIADVNTRNIVYFNMIRISDYL